MKNEGRDNEGAEEEYFLGKPRSNFFRPRTPLQSGPSTMNSAIEDMVDSNQVRTLATDLSRMTKLKILWNNREEDDETNIEFGGHIYNNNALISIFETNLPDTQGYDKDEDAIYRAESELLKDIVTVPGEEDSTRSKLEKLEEDSYNLKKRLSRIEGREGCIFIALHSLQDRVTTFINMVEPENLKKWLVNMESEILRQRIKENKNLQEIQTYRALAKKKMDRIDELEKQIQWCELALDSAMEERAELFQILERRTKELEEKRIAINKLMSSNFGENNDKDADKEENEDEKANEDEDESKDEKGWNASDDEEFYSYT